MTLATHTTQLAGPTFQVEVVDMEATGCAVGPATAPAPQMQANGIQRLELTLDNFILAPSTVAAERLLAEFEKECKEPLASLDRAHMSLYATVVKPYKSALLCIERAETDPVRIAMEGGLAEFLKLRGIKTNARGNVFHKFVRAAFGPKAHKARVSVYGIVLDVAHTEKVKPEDLVDWIASKGGVEAIRFKETPAGQGAGETAAIYATAEANVRSAAKFTFDLDPKDLDWLPTDNPEIVLLGTYHPTNNTMHVNAFVKNNVDALRAVIRAQCDKDPKAFQPAQPSSAKEGDIEGSAGSSDE